MKKALPFFVLLALGCGGANQTGTTGLFGTESGRNNPGSPSAPSTKESLTKGAGAKVIAAQNGFGFKLLGQIEAASEHQNVFISPYSITNALGMLLNGAAGDTREEILKALQMEKGRINDINDANRQLADLLRQKDENINFSSANSLWIKSGLKLDNEFLQRNRSYYSAQVLELADTPTEAAKKLNKWVEDNTSGKIKELASPKDLERIETVLANAVYFKGLWKEPFNTSATRRAEFTQSDGKKREMTMMSRSGDYPYLKSEGFEAIQIPYGGGKFAMTILLPSEGATAKKILSGLTPEKWTDMNSKFQSTKLTAFVPRFTSRSRFSLNAPLALLGMKSAFSAAANFSAMGKVKFFVDQVLHEAVVEVNEEGTEAAAATGVMMAVSAPALEFRADRPFIYAISNTETGSILFLGILNRPD